MPTGASQQHLLVGLVPRSAERSPRRHRHKVPVGGSTHSLTPQQAAYTAAPSHPSHPRAPSMRNDQIGGVSTGCFSKLISRFSSLILFHKVPVTFGSAI